jgi:hypothetical protein
MLGASLAACGGTTLLESSERAPDAASSSPDGTTEASELDARPAYPDSDAAVSPVDAAAGTGPVVRAGDDAGHSGVLLDAGAPDGHWVDSCGRSRPDVFGDEVISFMPGPTAGFGQSQLPCIVLGPPVGGGPTAGSLDVVSLGDQGSIVLAFDDVEVVDGPGPDLIVFENALPGFAEPGFVAVSDDGQTWHEWPCEPQDADGGYPDCAGVHATLSNPTNGISPTDPAVAGGDAFDFADLGVTRARYVRVRDSGFSHYAGTTGGFDLDAIAAVNSVPRSASASPQTGVVQDHPVRNIDALLPGAWAAARGHRDGARSGFASPASVLGAAR